MTDSRPRVLFLCTGNSCRSQMAEGWLRELGGGRVEALSAGTAPKGIHPGALAAMGAVGIDLGPQASESIELYLTDPPEVVIAVCDNAASNCPTLPGSAILRWPFPDPDAASGNESEVTAVFHAVRDSIRARLETWIAVWGDGPMTTEQLLRAAQHATPKL